MDLVLKNHALSKRQWEVVRLYCLGINLKEISSILNIGPKAVEYHWTKARVILGETNPIQLCHWALASGLIQNLYEIAKKGRQ